MMATATARIVSLRPAPEPEPPAYKEVALHTLAPGTRFVMHTPAVWGLEETRVYGELLWSNASRCRVLLAGQQKQVVFGVGDSGEKVRVFDADGCCEVSWPLEITVEALEDVTTGSGSAYTQDAGDPAGRSSVMADTKVTQAAGIQARYDYNQKLLVRAIEAGDEAKIGLLQGKIDGLLKEAADKGVDIKMLEANEEPEPAQEQAETPAPKPAAPAAAPVSKPGATAKKPPSVVGSEKAAAMAALDKKKQKVAGKAEPKAKAKPSSTHDCLCGCGKETLSLFAPGHDARVKGIILKVERGELDRDAIPDLCQPFVSFKGKWKTDGFTLTKCPVRIPGRPEIEHTGLQAMEALDV